MKREKELKDRALDVISQMKDILTSIRMDIRTGDSPSGAMVDSIKSRLGELELIVSQLQK